MNRKKILFILGVLDSGGVAKSLVNLLNVIDRQKYEVSLLLCSNQKGPYFELLPHDIKLIQNDVMASVGRLGGLSYLLRHGHLLLALGTVVRLIVSRFSKAWAGYILSRLMPAVPGEWDLIVDYNGQHQMYYMVDKLKARKKVTFFHSDYAKWPYYYRMDKRYYPRVDAIFTVSPACVASLKHYFPEQSDKIQLMENITSLKTILQMADEPLTLPRRSQWSLLTVGHVCKNKGTDLAIRTGKILQEKGLDFTWYFIGSAEELPQFNALIDECGVRDRFIFLGTKANPYPWFKAADIVVHPSLFEGKSVTLDEAKLLCKPVVVTNFSTVGDQFENGVNASIVDMTPQAVAEGIWHLVKDQALRNKYTNYLSLHMHDNSDEIIKIEKLLWD